MAKAKKCLCVVLAVMMVIGMFSFSVFAADENAAFTVTTDASDPASAGDEITVTVSLTTDYYVCVVAVPITYDTTAFTLVDNSVAVSDIFGSGTTSSVVNTNTAGEVYVVITPSTSGSPTTDKATNLTLFTFKLTANDVSGSYKIAVMENQKSSTNPSGKWYCGSVSSTDPKTGTVTSTGQTFTKVDATVNIGSAVVNTLVIKDTAPQSPVVDTTNNCGYTGSIYGIDTLDQNDDLEAKATLEECLTTALGDDYLQITLPESEYQTTGTIIEVLDSDKSTVLETYVFIFFGDVDEDGMITANDAYIIENYEGSVQGIDTFEQFIAADLDADGFATANDAYIATYFEGASEGVTTQAEIAELAQANEYEFIS